jgi:hypothetical protein
MAKGWTSLEKVSSVIQSTLLSPDLPVCLLIPAFSRAHMLCCDAVSCLDGAVAPYLCCSCPMAGRRSPGS